jgi:ABC-type enterochelin transport system permease subunit
MYFICCAGVLFFIAGMVLSVMGRQQFIAHTGAGTFQHAMLVDARNNWEPSLGLQTSARVEVRIITAFRHPIDAEATEIEFITRAALSGIYFVDVIPIAFSFWFLARLFKNISKGKIFIEKNAYFLLYFALLQIFAASVVPFIQFAICAIANQFSNSQITMLSNNWLFDGIPFMPVIIAAYIILYGVKLQDEVDATL